MLRQQLRVSCNSKGVVKVGGSETLDFTTLLPYLTGWVWCEVGRPAHCLCLQLSHFPKDWLGELFRVLWWVWGVCRRGVWIWLVLLHFWSSTACSGLKHRWGWFSAVEVSPWRQLPRY